MTQKHYADTCDCVRLRLNACFLVQGPDQIGFANCQQGVSLVKDDEEDKSILKTWILGHAAWVWLAL